MDARWNVTNSPYGGESSSHQAPLKGNLYILFLISLFLYHCVHEGAIHRVNAVLA